MQDKIIAGVVTFNRLELLKKVISGLRLQTLKPDKIVVINNSSTDGTEEWLAQESDLHVVKQDNLGSSGGQYTNMKTAYELGADWIWIMDDDVVPTKTCLENLMKFADKNKILAPLRFTPEGKAYSNDVIHLNMSNPLKTMWDGIANEKHFKIDIFKADGITFEGPLMHKSVPEKIGLPDKQFFIFGDDTEYMLRAIKNGFSNYIVSSARLDRQLPAPQSFQFDWKAYYHIRNVLSLDRLHGNFLVQQIRPHLYFRKFLKKAKTEEQIQTVKKAYKDAMNYKQEDLSL